MANSKSLCVKFSIVFSIIGCFLLSSPSISQTGGAAGWFSNIGPATGFGTSFVSSVNNANAIYLNPAGLKNVLKTEIFLTHIPLWEDASYNFVGMVFPSLNQTFSIGFSQLNSGDLVSRDNFGNEIGTFSDSYRILSFGFGFGFSKVFNLGFAIKGLNHEFVEKQTFGLSVDGGVIIGPFFGFKSGVRFQNIYADGYSGEHKKSLEQISPAYRYGISYSALQDRIVLSLDLESSSDRDNRTFLGVEVNAHENVIFKLGKVPSGNSVGIGLKLKDLFIDFVLVEHPLGSLQHFSISHRFGKPVDILREELLTKKKLAEELYASGLKMYEEQEFEAAYQQFKQAQEAWPKIESKLFKVSSKTKNIVKYYSEAEEKYELRQYEKAIISAEKCLNVESNHQKAVELLAEAKIKVELANEASKYYTQGIKYEKEGNISGAIDMWQKTLGIDPDYSLALSKLDEYKTSEPLKIELIQLNEVFAAVYKLYSDSPIGRIKLINRDVLDLYDIKVSVMIRKYFDFPTEDTRMRVDTLKTKSEIEVPLYAIFNNRLLDINVDTPLQAEIAVSYQYRNRPVRHELTSQLIIHNKNAIRWDDASMAAAFVTPNDPIIQTFISQAKAAIGLKTEDIIPDKVYNAMLLFDTMIASQLKYIPDPNNPFSQMQNKQALDHLKYPRETLLQGGGDCDDLAVLYCSLLEAVGIKTKLIDVPQHLFMMFDTAIPPERGYKLSTDKNMYVVDNNSIWIPVEVTELEKGFIEAWQIAARNYNKWSSR